jgi:glycosyltransferase involved in cell wall biosynthesis
MSNALLEAMAAARPVVATDVGGNPEVMVDGETGILVPPRRPDLLRAALERLLGDPELRRRLGRAARERAESRYSWDSVVASTIAVYEQAVPAPATR